MKVGIADLETDGLLDTVSKIHCLVIKDKSTGKNYRYSPSQIREGLEHLSTFDLIVMHNGVSYDYAVIRMLHPDIKLPEILDTLLMSRLIFPNIKDIDFNKRDRDKNYPLPMNMYGRHSLESWGYRLGILKGDYGKNTDWKLYTPEMLDYCEQDVEVTDVLYEMLKPHIADFGQSVWVEHEFAKIIHRQVERGWAFDIKKATQLYSELVAKRQQIAMEMTNTFDGWWEEMKSPAYYTCKGIKAPTKAEVRAKVKAHFPHMKLREIDEEIVAGENRKKHIPFNPSSRQHIHKVFAEKYNWKPKEFTERGEPKIDDDILKAMPYPEAQMLAEYFMLEKRIGQLAEGNQAWLKLVKQGRIHGSVNTNGAVTGRCTHSHPNVAQVPAARKNRDGSVKMGHEGGYGYECRELFTTTSGMVLVGADASGLELRCLAHYMAYWDNGKYSTIVTTGDIHTENQNAAGLPNRDNAKTFIYAFLYGAGDSKIGSIVGGGSKAGKALKERFLATLPALKSLVGMVQGAAKKGYIRGLDGRKLLIRSPHAALNTLLQGAGAILMKVALIFADRFLQEAGLVPGRDYEFVGNIHDEIQCECLPQHAEFVGETLTRAIKHAGEFFSFKCPLDGNYSKGSSWASTH
jgi:DNA polymerase-1